MNFSLDNILLIGSILMLVAIASTKIAKYGIPIVVLFIGLGMLAGSDGFGGINFTNSQITKFIGSVALCIILFSGGLDTKLENARSVWKPSIVLSSLGVLITAVVVGLAAHWLFNFTITEGLLIGSIVSSTDAATVFSVLRTRKMGLKGNLRYLIEFESGSNDPMAYFLTILFASILTAKITWGFQTVLLFLQQMSLGALIGWGMGIGMQRVINRLNLDFEGLYSVLLLALVFFTFAVSHYLGGNSFLSIYLAGIVLGNRDFIHKKSLIKHFDGQAWFMQVLMFVTLGLLVFPRDLLPLAGMGILLALVLIFVARPLAVFISLAPFKYNFRSKLFIAWAGLRGSVPIILAIYTQVYGVAISGLVFNLVFFISVISVLIQGTTFPFVAKRLHLCVPEDVRKRSAFDKEMRLAQKPIKAHLIIPPLAYCINKRVVELQLPKSCDIVWIKRKNKYMLHDGSFVFLEGDYVEYLADDELAVRRFEDRMVTNIRMRNQE